MINRSKLMTMAHRSAAGIVEDAGKDYRTAMAEALRDVWYWAKKMADDDAAAKYNGYRKLTAEIHVDRETDKAVHINNGREFDAWLPKSQMIIDKTGMYVREWLCKREAVGLFTTAA
jgi:hypothetical protein